VPIISALFGQLGTPARLGSLGLVELLNWTGEVLNRVDNRVFFSKFEEDQAVQYFYEPFLEAFDPELRRQLGVWYTPPEVVSYMVERVDEVLRADLGIPDGLASPEVVVLDPSTGTGSYLREVLNVVRKTLSAKGNDALVASDLKQAAMTRIFGFELLPAPLVVAHLQLGMALRNAGAPLVEGERVGVYLTNSLTGWEADADSTPAPLFHEFQDERDAADHVKQHEKVLVVIGNPPYNAFAGVSAAEENDIVASYKHGLRQSWGIRKFNLDDLYVRFFRLAERRIAHMTKRGIVCYISNFSYLDDSSFVVMREHLLNDFDQVWIDRMNGDSRETGKRTPSGEPDPSVFATRTGPGIRVGTAIALLAKNDPKGSKKATVRFRQFWGADKKQRLLESLQSGVPEYEVVEPKPENWYSFKPAAANSQWFEWPALTKLVEDGPYQGLAEDRRKALIDADRDRLSERMQRYLHPSLSLADLGLSCCFRGSSRHPSRQRRAVATAI